MPPEGFSVICFQDPDLVYRWFGGELHYYPNGQIASSWNTDWRDEIVRIDCHNIPIGTQMSMNLVTNPPFYPGVLEKPAEYSLLMKLEGTWVNTDKTGLGIHTTCMPSPGSSSEQIPGSFHFLSENYTEELRFDLVPGAVRNRGGSNEQMVGAVKYNQIIKSKNTDKLIHEENGMYLWLDDMYKHPASVESVKVDVGASAGIIPGTKGPTFLPRHKIARSGTIPHGSSILLLGEPRDKDEKPFKTRGASTSIPGKPEFPEGLATWNFDHLAISLSMGGAGDDPINLDEPPPAWVWDQTLPIRDPNGNRSYTQRILAHGLYPYSTRPDLRLRDTIRDHNIKSHELIILETQYDSGQGPQGGILNIPMIDKFTPVKKMTLRMWIEEVEEDGKTILQLQYEQLMHFAFGFGTDGGVTLWPHIQVNTLRKQE
jgi:hypothetical protein